MALIKEFFTELDSRWKPTGGEPIPLQIIGSAALMLQCDYERGTKDGDVLESKEVSPIIKERLLSLTGQGTDLYKQFRMYIDVVNSAILFSPQEMLFHPVTDLHLKNFSIHVLDIVDVVVSKLKRFNNNDRDDIRAMIDQNLLSHKKLISRFKLAVDHFFMDARAEDLPRYIKNLHDVERDLFALPETKIDLPDWMDR